MVYFYTIVSNDQISRFLAIIAHYGEPAIVNSTVRSGLGKMALSICYWSNYITITFIHVIFVYYDITKLLIHFNYLGHFCKTLWRV